jgi:cytochrome b561
MEPNSWLGVQSMKAFPPPREVVAYDPGLRTLHWLMAALIFVALPLGVWASLLPSGGAMRVEILFFHKSIGVTVFGLIALRIVWRLIVGAPAYAEPLGKVIRVASRAGHLALYALMIAMPVSGYVASTAGGRALPGSGCSSFPGSWPRIGRLPWRRAGRTWCSPGCLHSCSPRISAPSSGTLRSGTIPC